MKKLAEEILQMVHPYSVDSLYKYRSFEDKYFERIFTHQELYFANPSQFNDPFDSKAKSSTTFSDQEKEKYLREVINERWPDKGPQEVTDWVARTLEEDEIFQPDSMKELFAYMSSKYGICSFSEVRDDILMWSHYSGAHTGFCLEFDCKSEGSFFLGAFKVRYQPDIPTIDPLRFAEDPRNFLDAYTIKSTKWEYEQERRLVKDEPDGGAGVYRFIPENLTGVIFGARIDEKNMEFLEYLISNYPTKINTFKAQINQDNFVID